MDDAYYWVYRVFEKIVFQINSLARLLCITDDDGQRFIPNPFDRRMTWMQAGEWVMDTDEWKCLSCDSAMSYGAAKYLASTVAEQQWCPVHGRRGVILELQRGGSALRYHGCLKSCEDGSRAIDDDCPWILVMGNSLDEQPADSDVEILADVLDVDEWQRENGVNDDLEIIRRIANSDDDDAEYDDDDAEDDDV